MLLKQGSAAFREMPKRVDFGEISKLIDRRLAENRKMLEVLQFRSRSGSAAKLANFKAAASSIATQKVKKSKQPSLMRSRSKAAYSISNGTAQYKKQGSSSHSIDSPSMS